MLRSKKVHQNAINDGALVDYKNKITQYQPYHFSNYVTTLAKLLTETLAEAENYLELPQKNPGDILKLHAAKAKIKKHLRESPLSFPKLKTLLANHPELKNCFDQCQVVLKTPDDNIKLLSQELFTAQQTVGVLREKIFDVLHNIYQYPLIKEWLNREKLDDILLEQIQKNPYEFAQLIPKINDILKNQEKLRYENLKAKLETVQAEQTNVTTQERIKKLLSHLEILKKITPTEYPRLSKFIEQTLVMVRTNNTVALDPLNAALKKELSDDTVTLTVYFSGTGHRLTQNKRDKTIQLAGLLYKYNRVSPKEIKTPFKGCAVINPITGLLFGAGLKDQCQQVEQQVLQLLKNGKKVKLNCYGHSRGGIAALLLAKRLGHYAKDLVEINLALVDPVPGNYITTSSVDFLSQTLAKQAMDLSHCKNLNKVLALYPNQPLINRVGHAPIFPKYPSHCRVTQDVTSGCHSNAQEQKEFKETNEINFTPYSFVTFARVKRFLEKCGTHFDIPKKLVVTDYKYTHKDLLNKRILVTRTRDVLTAIYDMDKQLLKQDQVRITHSTKNVKIQTKAHIKSPYLNLQHKALLGDPLPNAEAVALQITPALLPNLPVAPVDYLSKDTWATFTVLLNKAHQEMSEKSKQSTKGTLMRRYIEEITQLNNFSNKESLVNALRSMIALALQRDRHAYSIFSTSKSGESILALLKLDQFKIFSQLILGSSDQPLRYRDLRMFVTGTNTPGYFNASHRDRLYRMLEENADPRADLSKNFLQYR